MNRWIFGEKYPTNNNNFWYQRSLAKNSQNVSIGKQHSINYIKRNFFFIKLYPQIIFHSIIRFPHQPPIPQQPNLGGKGKEKKK